MLGQRKHAVSTDSADSDTENQDPNPRPMKKLRKTRSRSSDESTSSFAASERHHGGKRETVGRGIQKEIGHEHCGRVLRFTRRLRRSIFEAILQLAKQN